MDKDELADRRDDLLRSLASPDPVFVDIGGSLARLEIWSEARWNSTEASERPSHAEHVNGLGSVVAIPVHDSK